MWLHGSPLLRRTKQHLEALPACLGNGFGSKRSWSQHGEDLLLLQILQQPHDNGFYVDIGANHPLKRSNTYRLYCLGMHGICIEPNRELYHIQMKYRPLDTHIHAGCADKEDEMVFYNMNYDVFSTYDKEEATIALQDQYKLGTKLLSEDNVAVTTLEKVLDQYEINGRSFDLLSVDTEGYDLRVLQGNNWDKYKPRIIIIEAADSEKTKEIDQYLESLSYRKKQRSGANLIYCRADSTPKEI